jgi:shikimate kinase
MATGKTSAAKEVAKKLGKRYISIDDLIAEKFQKTVSQIFYEEGEEEFRKMEVKTIEEVSKMENLVIDCGGGVIVKKVNISRLRRNGTIFLLKAQFDTILKRSSSQEGMRPLLRVEGEIEEIRRLFNFREPFYESSADYVIDTTGLSVEGVAEKVTEIFERSGCRGASKGKKK